MLDRSSKPADADALAKQTVDGARGASPPLEPNAGKDPAAVALGRKGGLKGGKARAAKLTAARRSEIARQAALKRWSDR